MNKQQGLALITTLWLVALLLIMTLTFSRTMNTEAQLIKHSLGQTQSEQLAETGVWMTLQLLLDRYDGQTTNLAAISTLIAERAQPLTVGIQDHNGLIDLNYAPAGLIQASLEGLGWDSARAEMLSHQIIDWRDSDHDKQPRGAEDSDYFAQGHLTGAKDGAFNTVEELRLLLTVSESVYQGIAELFTVYSQQRSVNVDLAPEQLQLSLQALHQAQNSAFPESDNYRSSWFNNRPGRVFSIHSQSELNDHVAQLEAVILLNPDQRRHYAILAWRHGEPKV